ncbi:MAG: hypothetical protein HFF69_06170 [Oscillospiraceae bacterium]|jgi:hypothetical protein|nr:hypothetical protein [Oscillospiraceae bacterium]
MAGIALISFNGWYSSAKPERNSELNLQLQKPSADSVTVVWAKYCVEYDHTKTFLDDGPTEQYFCLTEDVKTGEWTIVENDSPRVGPSEPDTP